MATTSTSPLLPVGEFRIIGAAPPDPGTSPYRAAIDFVRGRFWIEGDLLAAVRAYKGQAGSALSSWFDGWLVRISQTRPAAWLRSRSRTAGDIRFHYDRPNEFYRQFLDSRMVYSCAYFRDPATLLEAAQQDKLDLICHKLDLQPGDRLFDAGCGWGALLIRAAERYRALSTGCTLSRNQFQHADETIRSLGLADVASVCERDFREMEGTFDKVASVGMFEHVGRSGLGGYFRKIHGLLERDGLFLNHGIVRRSGFSENGESLFLQRQVFPGTALAGLPDVVDAAESAGFEVLDVENIRPHYALTCRAWVERLQRNAETCRAIVDEETYRTWLLYLAGSAVNFEDGYLDVHQILMARRDSRKRPLTRDEMFRRVLA